ncbi:CotH kinase family protein [bacterium]|nr:CotH kinase family protein [bacterium]
MIRICKLLIHIAIAATSVAAFGALIPPAHPLFESDQVHEIRLTFHQADWWSLLRANFEGQDDPQYLAAEFDWQTIHFDSIGVRFKGNSSYTGYPGVKKSFKLDIDEYVTDQTIYGLDKLNLNNGFNDPTFVREVCAYEICEAVGLPTVRTNYAALYINDEYWGLYTLVEQFDQEFIESRFGAGEEGNLWKGDPHGNFVFHGPNESAYYDSYELENNEEENDWSALVDIVATVNNVPLPNLVDSLHNRMDVNSAMAMLAVDIFTVNLDSYIGRCANYYFYHRDLDSRFVFAKWDMNEAWGVFNMQMNLNQLQQLDLHWVDPSPMDTRPLAERLWQIQDYDQIFVGHIRKLMATVADPDVLIDRMEDLRDIIRPWVYSDPNKMFTNADFDNSMTQNITQGPRSIPALGTFIENRHTWLETQLEPWTPIEGLVLNELMAANDSTIADNNGDFDDWIEVANISNSPINLSGLRLHDHFDGTLPYIFPDTTIQPGGYFVIWADEEPEQGLFHAPFKLDADGEDVYLTDDGVIVDQATFPDLATDISYGRWPDGNGAWQLLTAATPGDVNQNSSNPEDIILCINEFMALNETTVADEAGQFEDWIELYNPGPHSVQMGGLFLTDNLANPTKWMFPDTLFGVGNFLLVWCDNDPNDGPLHTTFGLSGDGEEIGLFGRLAAGNEEIDGHSFGAQSADISEGRATDCAGEWIVQTAPSPGASNGSVSTPGIENTIPFNFTLYQNYPNPFNPSTAIAFDLPVSGSVSLIIYNTVGQEIKRLVDEPLTAGHHEVVFDASSLPSGIYFYRFEASDFHSVRKMLLVK